MTHPDDTHATVQTALVGRGLKGRGLLDLTLGELNETEMEHAQDALYHLKMLDAALAERSDLNSIDSGREKRVSEWREGNDDEDDVPQTWSDGEEIRMRSVADEVNGESDIPRPPEADDEAVEQAFEETEDDSE